MTKDAIEIMNKLYGDSPEYLQEKKAYGKWLDNLGIRLAIKNVGIFKGPVNWEVEDESTRTL